MIFPVVCKVVYYVCALDHTVELEDNLPKCSKTR